MNIILLVFIVLISILIGIFVGSLVMYRTLIVSIKEIYKVDDDKYLSYSNYYSRPSRDEYYRTIYKLPENEKVKYEEKEIAKSEISNIITDMIIRDASESEIKRAVRYSIIVMDSAKFNLDIKKAYKEFQIEDLKIKYSK